MQRDRRHPLVRSAAAIGGVGLIVLGIGVGGTGPGAIVGVPLALTGTAVLTRSVA